MTQANKTTLCPHLLQLNQFLNIAWYNQLGKSISSLPPEVEIEDANLNFNLITNHKMSPA